jgi:putative flippase GtrA
MSTLVRWLVSLGVGVVTTILTLFLCILIDGWIRPQPGDGSFGMYGFVYGLIIAPLVGIAVAVVVGLWMRRRTMRA